MKTIKQIGLLFSLLCISASYAQSIQGEATYKSYRQMQIELDSSGVNDVMREQIMAQLKKQMEREYTLQFNQDEGLYKQVEALENAPLVGDGIEMVVVGSGASDILYTNLKDQRYANQNEMFGKLFLIKDSIEKRDWKLSKETKNIGDYTCFKATYTYEREAMRMRVRSSENPTDEEVEEEPAQQENIEVTAWYTPQIPVGAGPGQYQGLPGLILEVNDAELSILCSKIVLNPKKGVDIKEPTKGKQVSEATYDEILRKKMEEMEERFESDGRRNDGNNIEIRIGG